MKIRCDVCDKEEASVFCTADEASLCAACDHRVHHANKLASKHLRFSLLYPSSSSKHSPPLCDICQEKRAFLFCQQDRAILCKDCDTPIHTANDHTKKHNRFLLTGIKLSATSCQYEPPSVMSSSSSSPSLNSSHDFSVPGSSISQPPPAKKPESVSQTNSNSQPPLAKPPAMAMNTVVGVVGGDDGVVNQPEYTSSISEYLIDMLPGWHVEDFLDSSLAPFGFSKNVTEQECSQRRSIGSLPSENLGIWVPQIPPNQPSSYPNLYSSYYSSNNNNNNRETGIFKEAETAQTNTMRLGQNKRWLDDGGFTVPQIPITTSLHYSLPSNKKSRSLW